MHTVVLRLDPSLLDNPDLDLRYALVDLLAEQSGGVIADDGYDYVQDSNLLLLFLKASRPQVALACVLDVIENVRVLGNDLRQGVVVAISKGAKYEVVYPPNFQGPFLPE